MHGCANIGSTSRRRSMSPCRRSNISCRVNEDCRRLISIPGIGSLGATALVAAVGSATTFRKGRELAAWLGLVPRQWSTGGKPTPLGIGSGTRLPTRRALPLGYQMPCANRLRRRSLFVILRPSEKPDRECFHPFSSPACQSSHVKGGARGSPRWVPDNAGRIG